MAFWFLKGGGIVSATGLESFSEGQQSFPKDFLSVVAVYSFKLLLCGLSRNQETRRCPPVLQPWESRQYLGTTLGRVRGWWWLEELLGEPMGLVFQALPETKSTRGQPSVCAAIAPRSKDCVLRWASSVCQLQRGHHAKSTPSLLQKEGSPAAAPLEISEEVRAKLEERPQTSVEGGAMYTGQWLGAKRHGHGLYIAADGGKYEGQFVDDQAKGQGTYIAANGSTYNGQWQKDRAHGHGKYVHADGSTYEGEWYCDEKSGHGVESWTDGSKYDGEFLHGVKHGRGVYTTSTGLGYDGQFRQDKMDGEGCYRFVDGRTYKGQFRKSHLHGQGLMQWPDGSRYEGQYQNDLKHGEGSFYWPDGRTLHGQWQNGKHPSESGHSARATWFDSMD